MWKTVQRAKNIEHLRVSSKEIQKETILVFCCIEIDINFGQKFVFI